MNVSKGVTLIELMVTIAIAAILLTLGIPSFIDMFVNNRVRVQSDDMMAALALARTEAIKRAARMTVCKSSDHVSCTVGSNWNQGWIVFTDGGAEGSVDGTDQVLRVFEGNVAVAIVPPAGDTQFANFISYLPSGVISIYTASTGDVVAGRLQFCGSTTQDRQIEIKRTGRARVENVSC